MLSARSSNTNIPSEGSILKKPLKMANKLKNTTNIRKGLSVKVDRPSSLTNKPKPLQLSTNTIHAIQPKTPNLSENNKLNLNDDGPLKKKTQTPKVEKKTLLTSISDENDVEQFVPEPYNPLLDVHPFDEELYKKVLNLELADDGLPKFDSNEPFDF